MRLRTLAAFASLVFAALAPAAGRAADATAGYYRQPAIHGDVVVFVAEGDLWRVPIAGGVASRVTSHPGPEASPSISRDGKTLAFTASYEGAPDVYTMPLEGGLPLRRTWGAGRWAAPAGWSRDGRLLVTTAVRSLLPSDVQLGSLDLSRGDDTASLTMLPLAQAAGGDYDEAGVLFFTRQAFQGSHTKRYKGGTAEQIWRFGPGDAEAKLLTGDFTGTSKAPMFWQGRIYFASDRDGTMNLWSMAPDGSDAHQLTHHAGWDVQSPELDGGRIVYQLGADLRVFDVASGDDREIPIALESDFDQLRAKWIAEPITFLTAAHVSPKGDRVAITARGQVFVVPRRDGRLVEASRRPGVRYREARFLPDGKGLVALSDESGEVEVWRLPANGVGAGKQWTRDAHTLRWDAVPSPDGRWVAHHDKEGRLFLLDTKSGESRQIDRDERLGIADLTWSPDSRWLAYSATAPNLFTRVKLYGVEGKKVTEVTSDRYDSYSPAWSPDGKWLYLLSDRHLESVVGSVWGSYAPEPFLDKRTQVFELALKPATRSRFAPDDELSADKIEDKSDEAGKSDAKADGGVKDGKDGKDGKKAEEASKVPPVEIELAGLPGRLRELPFPPGNYSRLSVTDDALYWLATEPGAETGTLMGAKVANRKAEAKTVTGDVVAYELALDGKTMLVRKEKQIFLVDAAPDAAKLDDAAVDLSGWKPAIPNDRA